MSADQVRITEELAYQKARADTMGEVRPTPEYIFERYAKTKLWRHSEKEFIFRKVQDSCAKTIFEFGSGEGEITTQLARLGFDVTAMDISSELTQIAEKRAVLDGVRDRIEFVVGDILETPQPKGSFDCVLCIAVLHHVDLYRVFPVLLESLKPSGTMIIAEPIAFSPWLQRIRDALPIPKGVSPGERQLDRRDIDFILQQMRATRLKYFSLLERLSRFLPNANKIDRGHPFTKACLVALWVLDRAVLEILPMLRPLSGSIVIVGKKHAG